MSDNPFVPKYCMSCGEPITDEEDESNNGLCNECFEQDEEDDEDSDLILGDAW